MRHRWYLLITDKNDPQPFGHRAAPIPNRPSYSARTVETWPVGLVTPWNAVAEETPKASFVPSASGKQLLLHSSNYSCWYLPQAAVRMVGNKARCGSPATSFGSSGWPRPWLAAGVALGGQSAREGPIVGWASGRPAARRRVGTFSSAQVGLQCLHPS